MMNDRLVSVIITTYGDPSTLARAVNSVLGQTYKEIEILVIDDNDPASAFRKSTELVMARYQGLQRITYIQHERNLNGSAARNTGIEAAAGSYITFLDNDDFLLSDRIAAAVDVLQEDTSAGAVFCGVAHYRGQILTAVTVPTVEHLNQAALLGDEGIIGTGSNLFFRASAIQEVGLFDASFQRHQDLEYLMRYFRIGSCSTIPHIQVVKTVGPTDNSPGYEAALQAKKQFHSVFEKDIAQLNEEERVLYEVNVCNVLRYACAKDGNKETAKRISAYVDTLLRSRGMRKDIFKECKCTLKVNSPRLYSLAIKVLGPLLQKRKESQIEAWRLIEIHQLLAE